MAEGEGGNRGWLYDALQVLGYTDLYGMWARP